MKDGDFEPIRQYLCDFSNDPIYQQAIHDCFQARLDERHRLEEEIAKHREIMDREEVSIKQELERQIEITKKMEKKSNTVPPIRIMDSILQAEKGDNDPLYTAALRELDYEFPGIRR